MHQLNGEKQNTHVVLRINVMEHAGNKLIIKKKKYTHTYKHIYILTNIHTYIHINTHIHTYEHTYIHTFNQVPKASHIIVCSITSG